jgi:hypothetical protein
VAGCILVAVIVFCMRKHKRQKKESVPGASELPIDQENKHPYELSTHPVELPPNPQMVWELPTNALGRTSRVVS